MKTDEEIEALCKEQGIVVSKVKLDDGTEVMAYENTGDFASFRCYWCLTPYKGWEESRNCQCDKTGIAEQMVR